jgi:hypothetical protein
LPPGFDPDLAAFFAAALPGAEPREVEADEAWPADGLADRF